MINYSNSSVIKLNVKLILSRDCHSYLGDSKELYFENKETFDEWKQQNLPKEDKEHEIDIPLALPHEHCRMRQDTILYIKENNEFCKNFGSRTNFYYNNEQNGVNENVYKVFFPETELSLFKKQQEKDNDYPFESSWFELTIEEIQFVQKNTKCEGCINEYNNQLGHMGIGGCLSE